MLHVNPAVVTDIGTHRVIFIFSLALSFRLLPLPVGLRMEKPAHDKGRGYDAKQDRSKYLLPPVQEEDGVLLADVLVVVWLWRCL